MQDRESIMSWTDEYASQHMESLKIKPINNLPLMESLVEIKKNKVPIKERVGPICQPTRIVCIIYRSIKEEQAKCFRLCFLCDGNNLCGMCRCTPECYEDKEEIADEVSFVNARKEKEHEGCLLREEGFLGQIPSDESSSSPYIMCRKCSHMKEWPIISVEEKMCVVKFVSVRTALLFYQSHKSVFLLSFGVDMRAPFRISIPEKNIQLQVLERAFSIKKMEITETVFDCGSEQTPRETRIKTGIISVNEQEKSQEFISMASGRHSNVVLQGRIRGMTQESLLSCISALTSPEFIYLAKHKYGTYVIQLVVSMVKNPSLIEEVKKHIFPYSSGLLQHEIGNYVVQRIISYDARFVFDCFMKDFKRIVSSKIGSRAFKSCIKSFHLYRKEIIQILSSEFLESLPFEEQKVIRVALKEVLFLNSKTS
ncbi:hypothetical protein NEIG_02297 [Nematocida sp. ERTm5]|nr:hypothetical protein NEIG_02297 [Nematocida sp. ERTm5]